MGQPLIESKNVLRFFPVFQLRDDVKSVKISVYVGSIIYKREAVKSEDGSIGELIHPNFI